MSAHVDPEPRYGRRPATFTDVSGDPDQRLIDAVADRLLTFALEWRTHRYADTAREIVAMCAPPEGYVLLSPEEAEIAAGWASSVQSEWGVEALQGKELALARRLGLES